jgi:hypothetical protein
MSVRVLAPTVMELLGTLGFSEVQAKKKPSIEGG